MIAEINLPKKLPGEKIIKVVRRNPYVVFKRFLVFVFMLIIPIGFLIFFYINYPYVFEDSLGKAVIVLGTSAFYLFAWLLFFFSFMDYYLDIWVITSERIITIEQRGFFSRTICEQMMFRVQDVWSEVKGIIPTLLNFGEITVQNAGEEDTIVFHQASNPDKIRELIMKLADEQQKKMEHREIND